MRKLGKKQLTLQLLHPLRVLPKALAPYQLELAADGNEIVYTYDSQQHHNDIADLFKELRLAVIAFKDLQTTQRSLEDIFVQLVWKIGRAMCRERVCRYV